MRFEMPFDISWAWEPSTVDFFAFITVLLLLVAFAFWFFAMPVLGGVRHARIAWSRLRRRPVEIKSTESRRQFVQRGAIAFGGAVIATLGLYVGYATFRASNMIGALQYISEQGNNISSMETGIPATLCVYRWGEVSATTPHSESRAQHRQGCGPEIFVDPDTGRLAETFDVIQLYIEETILFAAESNIYKERYGADFYRGLEYWIADFSEDASGAISYYMVSREIDDAESDNRTFVDGRSLACLYDYTGISVENICQRYRDFVGSTNGVLLDRTTQVSCDVPADYTALPRSEPEYSCKASYWGVNFQGGREWTHPRNRPAQR